ncbi:tetratricopeptide repeat protein [Marivirga sp. S37H4]|uniref:Tetratricopeptide repeat protein n=1 Tax=Marivirga aurantiaca TaxID=2802615 RepID=A0A935CAR5_9BACT|nr:tetratricopeptide repeat protein [Marivirga aurantiaca]MBK6266352.1 tetratricopeptide repeat protein [Marivirga aurantiaca]
MNFKKFLVNHLLSMRIFILFIVTSTAYAQEVDELNPTLREANNINNKGYTLLESGHYSKAILHFQEAIALDPSQIIYYYNLADACLKLDDNNCALEAYSGAKLHHPDEADLYMYTADIYQKQNKLKEAISEYDKAINLVKEGNPLKYLFYFNRGNSYLKLKDYKAAVLNYTSTLNEFPDHYGAYANRGMAYYNLKRKAEACNDWIKASENGFSTAKEYISAYCN